jgi:putative iron-regulated protein
MNMKLIRNLGIALVICILAIALHSQTPSAVSATPNPIVAAAPSLGDRSILKDFADQVVIPTYQQLATKTKILDTAIKVLAQTPDSQNIKTAQAAWLDARIPLKQGVSFALGLARSWGLDGTLDTLPLDKTDLGKILHSEVPLTPEYISRQRDSLKGFRAIEFLLFGEHSQNASLSDRELAYLQATATVLDRDAHRLLDAWTVTRGKNPAFREVFSRAGEPDNEIYPLVATARQEIMEGMLETLEVLEDSIAEPFQEQDPKKIDSQYAIASSLQDFHNTLICVQNAYFGSFNRPISGAAGFSALVAQTNPQLNTQVESALKEAIAAVDTIPSPFHQAITAPHGRTKITQAIAAIAKVKDTLEADVKPLIL